MRCVRSTLFGAQCGIFISRLRNFVRDGLVSEKRVRSAVLVSVCHARARLFDIYSPRRRVCVCVYYGGYPCEFACVRLIDYYGETISVQDIYDSGETTNICCEDLGGVRFHKARQSVDVRAYRLKSSPLVL